MNSIHKINVNTHVYVKLTEYGRDILQNTNYRNHHQPEWDGFYKFQLWDLMNLFGEHHQMGFGKVPFENNEVWFSK